jgi:hypothetical protein
MLAQSIPGACDTSIELRKYRDTGLIRFQDGESIVCAPVIEDQDFIGLQSLLEN